jgi:hypothetical protein
MTPKQMVECAFRELQDQCRVQQRVIQFQTGMILILSGISFAQFQGLI